ncbi:MAG: hypothetical protein A2508_02695 [Candidatus Lambdaproteobacteria bacterium RIFOXYD12_FULL_49_8]|uniref:Response regulatory domain-containing protein n=1 Tax=Candidatus Lambdaproteobacteria bacterium RIFOXYD2_FULL_50_16 TaxID=1817772 RepID=A0A1F6GDN1_9PROT|nr:MAG: hypothetical protein A2527_04345 [Candidatus Lambdaproteobacteria bacterium RIFOXYD2_FULL_50_16]OGG98329.1 MAG: hypothetical protein A2508_02695 [Candidatus Lambdaproteobacteria bacterium RIFOXYD12_FULL_49_8]
MNLKLLLVCANDFPEDLHQRMQDFGFTTETARGGMRLKSLMEEQDFDAFVWCFDDYDQALRQDLLDIFNRRPKNPLVLLTGDLEAPDFLEQIAGPYGQLDLNDDPAELLAAIEFACLQPLIEEGAHLQEIDFKNLVHQVTHDKSRFAHQGAGTLKLQSAWLAVDGREKRILSSAKEPVKTGFFAGFAQWFKRA